MPRRFALLPAPAIALLLASVAFGGTPTGAGAPAPARPNRPAAVAPSRPLTSDEIAVSDLRLAGQQRVEACVARLAAAPDLASREAIQREITAAKRQTELDVLARLATLARTRGDLARAQSLDDAAAQLRTPRPLGLPAAAPKSTPAPARATEGGSR
jgi:hypothetical protein